MDVIQCPHCGDDMTPSAEETCPVCGRRILVVTADNAAAGESAGGSTNKAEDGAVAKASGTGLILALLISGVVAAMVYALLQNPPGAITASQENFQDFASTVETRLQTPRAGFVFGHVTPSTVQINAWQMGILRVGATRQSDQARMDFIVRYSREDGRWCLEDAEVSGEEAAKEAAESELAKGPASELVAAFAEAGGPGAAFYRKLAYRWVEEEEYDKVMPCCQEALRIDPRDVEAYLLRGRALLGKDEYDGAIADYSEVLRLDPPSEIAGIALFYRGTALTLRQSYGKAAEDFTESVRRKPEFWGTFFGRGAAWIGMRQYDKAL